MHRPLTRPIEIASDADSIFESYYKYTHGIEAATCTEMLQNCLDVQKKKDKTALLVALKALATLLLHQAYMTGFLSAFNLVFFFFYLFVGFVYFWFVLGFFNFILNGPLSLPFKPHITTCKNRTQPRWLKHTTKISSQDAMV